MKKIFLSTLLVTIFLFSCSKDDLTPSAKMTASIDGEDWTTISRVSVLKDDKFSITGTSLAGETLNITIFGSTEGTYALNLSTVKCAAIYKKALSSSTSDAYAAVSGEVILTEVNTSSKTISGTFSFSLKHGLTTETLSITNGSFDNLKYNVVE